MTLGDAKEVKHAMLPGTIDTNHLGFAPSDTTETTHLTRLYAYKGKATYSRTIEIPKQWKKAAVELFLERTKPTLRIAEMKVLHINQMAIFLFRNKKSRPQAALSP